MDNLPELLARVRQQYAVSQQELARRSHISLASIKAYEHGVRHPSRVYLTALLDALRLDLHTRNVVLIAAGYAADGADHIHHGIGGMMFSVDEAAAKIEDYPWPAFVMAERAEVCAANAAFQRLWGIDLLREFPTPVDRNALSIASLPRFADRILNWDQAVGIVLRSLKSYHRFDLDIEDPDPYFRAVLDRFSKGDPKYVGRLAAMWTDTSPLADEKIRWEYPIVWDAPGVGVLRFLCSVTTASLADGLSFNDWIPIDAATWSALDQLAR